MSPLIVNDAIAIVVDGIEHITFIRFSGGDGGTGQGLAIAHQIVQQHGGSNAIRNIEDRDGLMVEIRLPLPSAAP